MLPKDLENRIQIEDLPGEDLQDLARLCGIEVAIKLLKNFSGRNLYFPMNWTKAFRQKWVTQNWNGENAKELCSQLGVSYSTIYRAVNGKAVRSGPLLPRKSEKSQQLDLLK